MYYLFQALSKNITKFEAHLCDQNWLEQKLKLNVSASSVMLDPVFPIVCQKNFTVFIQMIFDEFGTKGLQAKVNVWVSSNHFEMTFTV